MGQMTADSMQRYRLSCVRSSDTRPERIVRSICHRAGYRFRLHRKDLPGTPDLVFPRLRRVIFVHGCFWHRHNCASGKKVPSVNAEYWLPKFERTKRRDRQAIRKLRRLGWKTLVVWECSTANVPALEAKLKKFLSSEGLGPK